MDIERIKKCIRNVPDYPKPGIQFKDITPILRDPELFSNIIDIFYDKYRPTIEHKYKKFVRPLQEIGKKSLEIYLIHWIILYIFFAHIYPVYKYKLFMNTITV